VATIQHKVETPYLVEPYGRQLLTPVEGPVFALPPLLDARLGGHEVSIELRTSADAAPYLCYRHRPRASTDPPHCCKRDHFEIIEAEQQPIRGIVSSQADPHLPKQRPSKGAGEVCLYLFFKAHVTDHRSHSLVRKEVHEVRVGAEAACEETSGLTQTLAE
jgi:hypothetical protein